MMPRALLVEPGITELRIALWRTCRPAAVDALTLRITHMGMLCAKQPPLSGDPCHPVLCSETVANCPPTKVYHADRIEAGLAVFVLDHDLVEAPEDWYRAGIEVDGCVVADMPLLVRRCGFCASLFRGLDSERFFFHPQLALLTSCITRETL